VKRIDMHIPEMAHVAGTEECGSAAAAIADDFLMGRWPHLPRPFKDHDRMRCLVEHACRWVVDKGCCCAITKAKYILSVLSNVFRPIAFSNVASLRVYVQINPRHCGSADITAAMAVRLAA
jgi:hypothetical protein